MRDLNNYSLYLLKLKSLKEKTLYLIRFVTSASLDFSNNLPRLLITLFWRSFIDNLRLSFSFYIIKAATIYILGLFLDSKGRPYCCYGYSGLSEITSK
jgi:hypothetical protein